MSLKVSIFWACSSSRISKSLGLEVLDRVPVLVGHDDVDADEVDARAEYRRLLRIGRAGGVCGLPEAGCPAAGVRRQVAAEPARGPERQSTRPSLNRMRPCERTTLAMVAILDRNGALNDFVPRSVVSGFSADRGNLPRLAVSGFRRTPDRG